MGITVRVGDLVVPKRLREKLVQVMTGELAPVVGEFLVRQIAYTHDVQGRTEDDKHGVWPPRKVPSSGIVVFSQRSDLKNAIKEMLRLKKEGKRKSVYEIQQQRLEGDDFSGVGRWGGGKAKFTHRQLLGAALALDEEKKNKNRKKELKQQIQEEFAKTSPDADKLATLKQLEMSTPRKITSLRSSRDSLKYRPRPVLFRTGTLRDSWNWKVLQEGKKTVIYIGTTVEYARVHFDGSVKKNIPARKEFVMTRKDRATITDLTNDIVGEEFGRLFGRR